MLKRRYLYYTTLIVLEIFVTDRRILEILLVGCWYGVWGYFGVFLDDGEGMHPIIETLLIIDFVNQNK